MTEPLFVAASTRLSVGDAVAALIVLENGDYLLQLRDERPDIWYPGHWGLFGGAIEAGEEPLAALMRELDEELDFALREARFFARFDFDLGGMRLGRYYRSYYVVPMTAAEHAGLKLGEGSAMRALPGAEALGTLRLSPYDGFALFLHFGGARIGAGFGGQFKNDA